MADQFYRKVDVFRPAEVPASARYGAAPAAAAAASSPATTAGAAPAAPR